MNKNKYIKQKLKEDGLYNEALEYTANMLYAGVPLCVDGFPNASYKQTRGSQVRIAIAKYREEYSWIMYNRFKARASGENLFEAGVKEGYKQALSDVSDSIKANTLVIDVKQKIANLRDIINKGRQ